MKPFNQPVFVTGAERSGSSLIARILELSGIFTGRTTNMFENIKLLNLSRTYLQYPPITGYHTPPRDHFFPKTDQLNIPLDWKNKVDHILREEGYRNNQWMFKCSLIAPMWPIWNYAYPNARWLIVRRRTGDVIESCVKTTYMTLCKDQLNLDKINVTTEREGWKWWVHQYEEKFVEMIEAGVNCKIIWPERMVSGDYQQIYETLEWLGFNWSTKIVEVIDPMLIKSRRKYNGTSYGG